LLYCFTRFSPGKEYDYVAYELQKNLKTVVYKKILMTSNSVFLRQHLQHLFTKK